MGDKISRVAAVDKSTKRLMALKAYVKSSKSEIAIDGTTHKVPAVIAMYQSAIDTRAAVETKLAEIKQAMAERATAEAQRRAADRALKPWVINQFGANSQEAHDFGFPPPKKPVRTVEEKQQAVVLGQATREARGTKGKKEKLKIKGVVPTSPAPAAPATTAHAAPPLPAVASPSPAPAPAPQAPSPQQAPVAPPLTTATAPPPVVNGTAHS